MPSLTVKWVYILDADFVFNIKPYLTEPLNDGCAFVDKKGVRRLEIRPNGDAVVLKGYAWDGCTPKFTLFDSIVGIPDGVPNHSTTKPKAYYASLLHDALYQFMDLDMPISRKGADEVFLALLKRDDFGPRRVYYAAVRYLGGIFHQFTRWKRNYAGKRVPL